METLGYVLVGFGAPLARNSDGILYWAALLMVLAGIRIIIREIARGVCKEEAEKKGRMDAPLGIR